LLYYTASSVCPQVNAEHVAIKQLNIACNWYL